MMAKAKVMEPIRPKTEKYASSDAELIRDKGVSAADIKRDRSSFVIGGETSS